MINHTFKTLALLLLMTMFSSAAAAGRRRPGPLYYTAAAGRRSGKGGTDPGPLPTQYAPHDALIRNLHTHAISVRVFDPTPQVNSVRAHTQNGNRARNGNSNATSRSGKTRTSNLQMRENQGGRQDANSRMNTAGDQSMNMASDHSDVQSGRAETRKRSSNNTSSHKYGGSAGAKFMGFGANASFFNGGSSGKQRSSDDSNQASDRHARGSIHVHENTSYNANANASSNASHFGNQHMNDHSDEENFDNYDSEGITAEGEVYDETNQEALFNHPQIETRKSVIPGTIDERGNSHYGGQLLVGALLPSNGTARTCIQLEIRLTDTNRLIFSGGINQGVTDIIVTERSAYPIRSSEYSEAIGRLMRLGFAGPQLEEVKCRLFMGSKLYQDGQQEAASSWEHLEAENFEAMGITKDDGNMFMRAIRNIRGGRSVSFGNGAGAEHAIMTPNIILMDRLLRERDAEHREITIRLHQAEKEKEALNKTLRALNKTLKKAMGEIQELRKQLAKALAKAGN